MDINVWPVSISVIDNVLDPELQRTLIEESVIPTTIQGQNIFGMTPAQTELFKVVKMSVINYCLQSELDFDKLELSSLQKGNLKKYSKEMVHDALYEPHHDIAEGAYVNAIYYINSDWSEDNWVGGELTIYKHMSIVEYPNSTVTILPKPNRLVIFPGFITHRVKPYFGENPRSTLVFGWRYTGDPNNINPLVI